MAKPAIKLPKLDSKLPDLNALLAPPSAAQLEPGEEESLLSRIAHSRPMGALATIGHILDTPGSIMRGLASGHNPLPGIFDPEQRISGRQMLEHWGALDHNTTGLDAGDVAGFAAELATDPLTFLTLGAGAVAKGGAQGVAKLSVPFTKLEKVVGVGSGAARGIERAKDAVRFGALPGTSYSPGRHLAQLFDPNVKGLYTKAGQQTAQDLSARHAAREASQRQFTARQAVDLGNLGDDSLRQLYEGVRSSTNPVEATAVANKRILLGGLLDEAQRAGLQREALTDVIEHSHRFATQMPGVRMPSSAARPGALLSTMNPAAIGRNRAFKGLPGGTADLRAIISDEAINDLIDSGAKLKEVVAKAKELHGAKLPAVFIAGMKNGETVFKDQMTEIVKKMRRYPRELRDIGIFGNSPLADLEKGALGLGKATDTAQAVQAALAKHATRGAGVPAQQILKRFGIANPALQGSIPRELADELLSLKEVWKAPESVGKLVGALDSYNSLFKAGVLSWPARHVRDLVSGLHRSWQAGHVGIIEQPGAVSAAYKLARGGSVPGAHQLPAVAAELSRRLLPATEENGTRILRELAYAHQVSSPAQSRLAQVAQATPVEGQKIADILHALPGAHPVPLRETARKFVGRAEGTTLKNPLAIAGVGKHTETRFGPAAASNDLGHLTDSLNRLAPWLNLLKRGMDPAQAAELVRKAQVDYSAKALTGFERKFLSRAVPFYRFLKGNTISQATELAAHPGGRLAQTFRALNNARSRDEIVPDYVEDTTGIRVPEGLPLVGSKPGGDPRYFTGLGLMFEDPAHFATGPVGLLREAGSRLGPAAKLPIELVTGKSLFQKGPEGLSDLEDQDPVLGRLLANLSGRKEPVPTSRTLETVLSNTPATRLLGTLRTATDTRKNLATKALNLGTGLRFTDVPESRRDAILKDLLAQEMKRSGASTYEKVYFSERDLARLSPQEQEAAAKAMALQQRLSKRAKDRKAQRLAAAP